jgi:hypothetical protein
MNDSSELSKLPDWQVEYEIGGQTKKPVIKAPSAEKAQEYIEFTSRQQSNRPIRVIKVTRVKKP